jgi:hypothetical protein
MIAADAGFGEGAPEGVGDGTPGPPPRGVGLTASALEKMKVSAAKISERKQEIGMIICLR